MAKEGLSGLPKNNIDWFVFIASVALVFLVCVPQAGYPVEGPMLLDRAFTYVTGEFGVVYVLMSVTTLGFLGYLRGRLLTCLTTALAE